MKGCGEPASDLLIEATSANHRNRGNAMAFYPTVLIAM